MKIIYSILLAIVIASTSLISNVSASSPVNIYTTFNNKEIQVPQELKPIKKGKNILFPIRFLADLINSEVSYDGSKKTAIVKTKTGVTLEIPEGKNYIYVDGFKRKTPVQNISINEKIYMDGRTYFTAINASSDIIPTPEGYEFSITGYQNKLNPKFIRTPGSSFITEGSTYTYAVESKQTFIVKDNEISIYSLDESSIELLKNVISNIVDSDDRADAISKQVMAVWNDRSNPNTEYVSGRNYQSCDNFYFTFTKGSDSITFTIKYGYSQLFAH